jgi:cobalt-zinc-cadmium resistance protein CzcA
VAVLNGIVLIAEFNSQRNSGLTDTVKIIMNGTRKRLRPILMTAFVASLGFLPMAISNGSGAEVQRPLATVVIGGLLIATFLTLFILPILYLVFEQKSEIKMNKNSVLSVLFLLGTVTSFSQNKITLEQAINTGISNNIQLKIEKQKLEAAKVLIRSANEVPSLNLVGEVGQLNSAYTDNRFGISQNISFPFINAKKRDWFAKQADMAQMNYKFSENALKKEITQSFYDLVVVSEKEKVMEQTDSIFASFITKANLRLKYGESSAFEKSSAELFMVKIKNQLKLIEEEKLKILLQLQFLLQINETIIPIYKSAKIDVLPAQDFVTNNLELQMLALDKQTNASLLKIEKSALIPDISVGYFSTTMQGNGADNNFYGKNDRFQSFQLSLGIPVFNSANKARQKAIKINETIMIDKAAMHQQELQKTWNNYFVKHKNNQDVLSYYEKVVLPNTKIIISNANKQILNGDINFMEWSWTMNQALEAKADYLDKIQSYNTNIIQILYFN